MSDKEEIQFKFDEEGASPANSPRDKKKKDEAALHGTEQNPKESSPRKPIMMVAGLWENFYSRIFWNAL